jgi:hypothetical protein
MSQLGICVQGHEVGGGGGVILCLPSTAYDLKHL